MSLFFTFNMCVCVCVYYGYIYVCGVYMSCHSCEIRGQIAGVISPFAVCGFQGLNSGCKTWHEAPSI